MKNWYLLFKTRNLTQANIIKGMLEENSVPVMLINKQSSAYVMFGDVELYVPVHLRKVAEQLLAQGLVN